MREKLESLFVRLFFKVIKDYSIFFLVDDGAYYVNDITVDVETKEIVMKYEYRRGLNNESIE